MEGKLPIRRNKFTDEAVHQYGGNGAKVESFWNRGWVVPEQLYDGNGAVLSYEQIVAPMLSERVYGGVRENSIDFSRILYRLSSDTL